MDLVYFCCGCYLTVELVFYSMVQCSLDLDHHFIVSYCSTSALDNYKMLNQSLFCNLCNKELIVVT